MAAEPDELIDDAVGVVTNATVGEPHHVVAVHGGLGIAPPVAFEVGATIVEGAAVGLENEPPLGHQRVDDVPGRRGPGRGRLADDPRHAGHERDHRQECALQLALGRRFALEFGGEFRQAP